MSMVHAQDMGGYSANLSICLSPECHRRTRASRSPSVATRSEAVTTPADIRSTPGKDTDALDPLIHPSNPAGRRSEAHGVAWYQLESFLKYFFIRPCL
jgi:hypothetical protein